MSDDRTRAVLDDIRRFAVTARRVVARGRTDFADPEIDDQRRIARSLIVDLSTAADRLSEDFRHRHGDVDWRGIRAARKFIARDYAGTDDRILWQAIAVDFPRIITAVGLDEPT